MVFTPFQAPSPLMEMPADWRAGLETKSWSAWRISTWSSNRPNQCDPLRRNCTWFHSSEQISGCGKRSWRGLFATGECWQKYLELRFQSKRVCYILQTNSIYTNWISFDSNSNVTISANEMASLRFLLDGATICPEFKGKSHLNTQLRSTLLVIRKMETQLALA